MSALNPTSHPSSAPLPVERSDRSNVESEPSTQSCFRLDPLVGQVLNGLENPAFIQDDQHRWLMVNDIFCQWIGHRKSDLVGHYIRSVLTTAEAERFHTRCQQVIDTGLACEAEETLTDVIGNTHNVIFKASILIDPQGQRLVLVNFYDITQRKQMEFNLRQSEQLLLRVIDTIPQAIYWKDRNGQYLGCNRKFAKQMGEKSPKFIVGKTERDFMGATDKADLYHQRDRQVIESGYPSLHLIETRLSASGLPVWFDTSRIPLRDRDGNVVGVLVTQENITERIQADDELRKSQQRLSLLIKQTPLAVVEWSRDSIITAWNPAAQRIFGFTANEAINQHVNFLVPECDRVYVDNIFDEIIRQQQSNRNINKNVTKDGRIITCEWYDIPLVTSSGEVIGIASMGLDITEQEAAAEALRQSEMRLRQQTQDLEEAIQELQQAQIRLVQSEKMSSLGQLVAGVAHEINNPVNFIYGNLNHAKEYTRDLLTLLDLYQQHYPNPSSEIVDEIEAIDLEFLLEDLPKLLNSMKVGADRIQQIVASLRTFSRMDESEMKAVDIHEGLDSTLMILQNRIKAKSDRVAIEVVKRYCELPLIECYAGQLNQVFMNIISNAIDALEELLVTDKTVAPCITLTTELPNDHEVTIRIGDNGAGIPQDMIQRLFDPFFTTKPIGKGTGMGLSISYQIITEKHGGTLHCESQPGEGTSFVMTIPQRQP